MAGLGRISSRAGRAPAAPPAVTARELAWTYRSIRPDAASAKRDVARRIAHLEAERPGSRRLPLLRQALRELEKPEYE